MHTPQCVDRQQKSFELHRIFYELKQVDAAWSKLISMIVKTMRFVARISDSCLSVRQNDNLTWLYVKCVSR